jgi:YHS domain-containing protein
MVSMSERRTVMKLLAALAVAGAVGSFEAVAQGATPAGEKLGLKGYDPVAYFTDRKARPGEPEFEYAWDGVRYRFASAAHRDLFKANPEKYAPQFGGSCAMNMSNGVRREADPNNWTISDGKLYVFATARGFDLFRANPTQAAHRAVANWPTLKNMPTQ